MNYEISTYDAFGVDEVKCSNGRASNLGENYLLFDQKVSITHKIFLISKFSVL